MSCWLQDAIIRSVDRFIDVRYHGMSMPDETHADGTGIDAWKAHTSAFDRIQSVATTVSQPRSAAQIAADAQVAENTARDHLDRLVGLNVLLTHDQKGTTLYAPDPLQTRMQTLRDLLDTHDHDGLIQLKAELQDRIDAWRDEYAAESPDELRERAAETDDAVQTRAIRHTAQDWELVQYRLGVVEDVIRNYGTYTRGGQVSSSSSSSSSA
jgi:hypothetical protein